MDIESTSARNARRLRTRILVGTGVVIGGLWLIWDSWGLEASGFVEALAGVVVLIVVMSALGAGFGALLGTLRRGRDDRSDRAARDAAERERREPRDP